MACVVVVLPIVDDGDWFPAAKFDLGFELLPRCLIPDFNGVIFSSDWKEALWSKFYMGAPRQQRRCVERYSIVKRA